MRAWVLPFMAVIALGCGKSDREGRSSEPEAAAARAAPAARATPSPAELPAARQELVERLNASFKDKGTARLDGQALVVESPQCRDPRQAAQVVELVGKAAARVDIHDVRCQAPPSPSQDEAAHRR